VREIEMLVPPAAVRHALNSVLDEFEERRYLGMSQIGDCPRRLYWGLVRGREPPDMRGRQYFHEGYLHQADVIARLERAGLHVANREAELVAPWDERFRGHVDGTLNGALLEIKSTTAHTMERIRVRGLRQRDAAQVQAYLRYADLPHALVVYKARENGAIWVVDVARSESAGKRLEEKARYILHAVDTGIPPTCTCGRCR